MTGALMPAAARLGRLFEIVWWSRSGSPPIDAPIDPLGPVSQDPDAVRDAACRLVESQDVCKPPSPPPTFSPDTSAGGGDSGGVGGSLLGALFWVLLIAVVLALVSVAVRYFSERRGTSGTDRGGDDVDPDDDSLVGMVIIDRSREPKSWREEADEHRSAGRCRDALRCRYRALVGDLARRGLLDEIPGRTTGEERRQLRTSAPDAAGYFREAADLFDEVWYGHAVVGAEHDDRFQQLDRDVLVRATAMPHRIPRSYEVPRDSDPSRSYESSAV